MHTVLIQYTGWVGHEYGLEHGTHFELVVVPGRMQDGRRLQHAVPSAGAHYSPHPLSSPHRHPLGSPHHDLSSPHHHVLGSPSGGSASSTPLSVSRSHHYSGEGRAAAALSNTRPGMLQHRPPTTVVMHVQVQYTLHTLYTLHTQYTLHTLCTMHHALCTMRHAPCTMHHAPCAMHHAPCTMHHMHCTLEVVMQAQA
jgi:hypothetical protein